MSAAAELKGPISLPAWTTSRLNDGEPLLGHAGCEPIMLVKREARSAPSRGLTHYGGPLAEGNRRGRHIRCPWHHARFDCARRALRGRGRDSIPCYRVERQVDACVSGNVSRRKGPRSAGRRALSSSELARRPRLAEELRRQGYEGPITMFGSEDTLPSPANLSKDYLAAAARDWSPLRGREFYSERRDRLARAGRGSPREVDGERCGCRPDGRCGTSAAARNRRGACPSGIPRADRALTLRTLADSRAIVAGAAPAGARRHRRQLHRPGRSQRRAPAKDGGDLSWPPRPRGPPTSNASSTGARRLRAGAA